VQAHTLGEVGILGTVLIRVSSGTILTIFIEIGSYLTERAKNKLAQFFLRHGVFVLTIQLYNAYLSVPARLSCWSALATE